MRTFEYLISTKPLAMHAEVCQKDRGVHNIRSHADGPESEINGDSSAIQIMLEMQKSKTSADHKTACWLH